jgi:hypothetical protein
MKTSHKGMKISESDCLAFSWHLDATLDAFHVPQAERAEVVSFIQSTKGDIVEPLVGADAEQPRLPRESPRSPMLDHVSIPVTDLDRAARFLTSVCLSRVSRQKRKDSGAMLACADGRHVILAG